MRLSASVLPMTEKEDFIEHGHYRAGSDVYIYHYRHEFLFNESRQYPSRRRRGREQTTLKYRRLA